jgi:hypothetical protein
VTTIRADQPLAIVTDGNTANEVRHARNVPLSPQRINP